MAKFVTEFIFDILKFLKIDLKEIYLSCRKEKNEEAALEMEQSSADKQLEELAWTEGLIDGLDLPTPVENKTNLSREELTDRIKEEHVYVFREQHEFVMYGKVTFNGDRIWIHSFEHLKPDGNPFLIPLKELLFAFNGSIKFPIKAFLQIEHEYVIIATGRSSPRAFNFLLLCSGLKGSSYKGKTLKRYSNTVGTVSSEEVAAVVSGIVDGGVYEATVQKGIVCGCWSKHPDNLSRFNVWMENPPVRVTTKFGFVEEGMETLERLFKDNRSYQIKNCGLVIQSAKAIIEKIEDVVPQPSVDSVSPPPRPGLTIVPMTIDNLFQL